MVDHWSRLPSREKIKALLYLAPKNRLVVLELYLAHANEQGFAWLSRDTISRETGLSSATIANARGWLINHGALRKVDQKTRDHLRAQGYRLGQASVYYVTGEI